VVIIAKDEFNMDLDKYIDKKRRGGTLGFKGTKSIFTRAERYEETPRKQAFSFSSVTRVFRKRIPGEEDIERRSHVRKKQEEPVKKEELEDMEYELKDIEEEEYELEAEREGLLKRFFKKLRIFNKAPEESLEEEYEEEPSVDEELREAIKILHKWIEKLPKKELNEFKNSPDFAKYKDALKKLKMIKE
jgi:hypothetical protein